MKNLFLLSVIFNMILSCTPQDEEDCSCMRPPIRTDFYFTQEISKTSGGVKSKDKKAGFKIVINSIDKIKPKPYFFNRTAVEADGDHYYKENTFKLPLEINIPLGENFKKKLLFHPIFADKERLLNLKIYKEGKLLMTKNISYKSIPFDDFKESGQNKNDILDKGTVFFYTYPYVKIDGKVEKVDFSRIELNELKIGIRNKNSYFLQK